MFEGGTSMLLSTERTELVRCGMEPQTNVEISNASSLVTIRFESVCTFKFKFSCTDTLCYLLVILPKVAWLPAKSGGAHFSTIMCLHALIGRFMWNNC